MLNDSASREKAEKRAEKAKAKLAATAPHLRPREKVVAASAKPTRRGREPRTQEAPPMQAGVIRIPDCCGDCEHFDSTRQEPTFSGRCAHQGVEATQLLVVRNQKPPRLCPLRPRFCERCNARIESGSLCSPPCDEKATPPIETTTARTRGRAAQKAGGLDSKTLRDWYRQHAACFGPAVEGHAAPCRAPVSPPHHAHSTGASGEAKIDAMNLCPYCWKAHTLAHAGIISREACKIAAFDAWMLFCRIAESATKEVVLQELMGLVP